jgi:hypothetical protein
MDAETAKKLSEARENMFGDLKPQGGKSFIIVKGDVRITPKSPGLIVKRER